MSVSSEINRIRNNIAAAYDALRNKGAIIPAVENSGNLGSAIASIKISNVKYTNVEPDPSSYDDGDIIVYYEE